MLTMTSPAVPDSLDSTVNMVGSACVWMIRAAPGYARNLLHFGRAERTGDLALYLWLDLMGGKAATAAAAPGRKASVAACSAR